MAVIVSAGGELDASNDAIWRRLLSEAAAAAGPPGPLVVDISGLDFMGCCAYAALAEEAERCRDRGVEMRLVSNQPVVSRIVRRAASASCCRWTIAWTPRCRRASPSTDTRSLSSCKCAGPEALCRVRPADWSVATSRTSRILRAPQVAGEVRAAHPPLAT